MSGVNDFLTDDQMTDRTNVNDMDPWDVIESACIGMGIVYNKPDPKCKKCHGRGWTGRRLVPDVDANGQPKLDEYGKQIFIKEPIACNCIFPKNEYEKEIGPSGAYFRPHNRKERRTKRN